MTDICKTQNKSIRHVCKTHSTPIRRPMKMIKAHTTTTPIFPTDDKSSHHNNPTYPKPISNPFESYPFTYTYLLSQERDKNIRRGLPPTTPHNNDSTQHFSNWKRKIVLIIVVASLVERIGSRFFDHNYMS